MNENNNNHKTVNDTKPVLSEICMAGGYAGFSVSQSLHDKTKSYIMKQEEHHKRMTFKEELIAFLKEYNVDYDERYLWTD